MRMTRLIIWKFLMCCYLLPVDHDTISLSLRAESRSGVVGEGAAEPWRPRDFSHFGVLRTALLLRFNCVL